MAIALVLEEIPLSDVAGMVARGEAVYDEADLPAPAAAAGGVDAEPAVVVPAQDEDRVWQQEERVPRR